MYRRMADCYIIRLPKTSVLFSAYGQPRILRHLTWDPKASMGNVAECRLSWDKDLEIHAVCSKFEQRSSIRAGKFLFSMALTNIFPVLSAVSGYLMTQKANAYCLVLNVRCLQNARMFTHPFSAGTEEKQRRTSQRLKRVLIPTTTENLGPTSLNVNRHVLFAVLTTAASVLTAPVTEAWRRPISPSD